MLDELVRCITATRFAGLPGPVVDAARSFLLDCIAVGVAGCRHPHRDALARVVAGWGLGGPARVLGDTQRLPAASAAFLNAYQMHCLEFDCVHEAAVVHAMTAPAAAALAECEQRPGVAGEQLLRALVLGVEVATLLGLAATAPLTFFRPATTGVFGAAVAVGALRGFDATRFRHCFGHALSQAAGTMQAHEEGKPTLPLQLAGAARAGLVSADLAEAGIPAPKDALEGRYGYFRLFEQNWDVADLVDGLGSTWRVTELSHKPYPSGRATHGGIAGVLRLRGRGVTAENLARLVLTAPPLIHQLVIRPVRPAMSANYARLCFAYVGALALTQGDVALEHFSSDWLHAPALLALARRFEARVNPTPNPAAFVPQTLAAELIDGTVRELRIDALPGAPQSPLSPAQRSAKARACLASVYDDGARADTLLQAVGRLPETTSAARLLDPVTGP